MKRIFLSLLLSILFSISLLAESGFQFILNAPFSAGINFDPIYTIQQNVLSAEYKSKTTIGFDTGVTAQFGYLFNILPKLGLSVLGEFGYSYNTFKGVYSIDTMNDRFGIGNEIGRIDYNTHSIVGGALIKVNLDKFSIGVGFGVLTPMSINRNFENEALKLAIANKSTSITKYPLSFAGYYVKLTFDYSLYFTEKLALNVGLFTALNYIGVAETIIDDNSPQGKLLSESTLMNYDIGIQVGLRFAPQL